MKVFDKLKSFAVATLTVKAATPLNPVEQHFTDCDPTRPKTELAKKANGALVGEAIARCQLEEATSILLCVTKEVVDRAVHDRQQKQIGEQVLGGH